MSKKRKGMGRIRIRMKTRLIEAGNARSRKYDIITTFTRSSLATAKAPHTLDPSRWISRLEYMGIFSAMYIPLGVFATRNDSQHTCSSAREDRERRALGLLKF